ncbi:MAG: hypothetical protein LBO74_01485 [Candidatus Symbiothrix sp.]|jgi:CheY-like chemotaxis protein|nr:hypothetical protein [Candidatus Symbiothrix sp.]
MNKTYQVIVVDDQPEGMEIIMKLVKDIVWRQAHYSITYNILSRRGEITNINDLRGDIVLFDCNLSGANFDFSGYDESTYGFELIKRYREQNKRTKIIFYSGSFDFSHEMDLGSLLLKDLVAMINELNIFKLCNREGPMLADAITEAISNIDAVLVSLDELIADFGETSEFHVGDTCISAAKLIDEIKKGSPIGEEFRAQVSETIITYFMKFGETVQQ